MTGGVVLAFYATYFAYRNLKSIVPLLRDELFDRRLGDIDRSVFGGSDPAQVLHDLLGTGISAEVLSVIYGLFFVFVPVSIALALVVPRDPRPGLFFVTALSLNWVLAAGSYFLLPSLGPVYAQPENFADLPSTGVSHLQTALLNQRLDFLHDPAAAGAAQSIGAFASLHVSIFFTAALATAPARRPAARVRSGLGAAGADRPGHALLRLALRARRRRRHAHRGHLARAGASADRLRARAPPADACPPPSPRPHDAARRTPPRARARGLARRGAAEPARGAGRPDRGRAHAPGRRSGPRSAPTCRCATPTTSPRSTSCWSPAASW